MDTLNALPIGTVLDADYRVIRVLGAGGFGITYLAEEISLARKVAVKEYFPGEFATRDGPTVVRSRSMTYQEDYQWGLDRFIAEAQVLAKFDHPNVGRVLRYFRANNTGYMVLRFEEGKSFKAFIDRLGRPPTQGEFDAIARPLLNALELIHAQDFLHRDIAPDNIVIRDDGSPVLIDFGSARSDVADGSKAVSALVKPGYSPFEQYAANGKTQGPWTDIYALGATLYHAVAGSRPADSPTRMQSDDLKPARAVAKASYRPEFLSAIDHALRLKIDERPQNVSEWRKELFAVLETGGVARTPAGKAQSLTPAKTRKLDPEALLPKRWMKRSGGGAKAGANAALAIPLPEPDPMTIALKAEARPIAIAQAAEQKAAPANNVVQLKRPPELAAPPPVAPAAPAEPARKRPSLLSLLADVRPAPSEAAAVSPGPATPPKPVPAMKAASAKPKRAIPRVPFRIGRRMQIDLTTRLVASLAVVSAIVFHQEWMPLFGLMAKPAATVSTLSLGALPQVTDVSLQRTLRGHDKPIVGLTAGGDGQTLMSSSGDGQITIWNVATGEMTRKLAGVEGETEAIAASGTTLIAAGRDGSVRLWNTATGEPGKVLRGNDGPLNAVAYGAGGTFVTAGLDHRIRFWNDARGERFSLTGHTSSVLAVDYLADKRLIVSGGADNTVRLWDARRRRFLRSFQGHTDTVSAVALSADGAMIASGSTDKSVILWSRATGESLRVLSGHTGGVTALAFSPNGRLVASGSVDGTVKLWNVMTGELLTTYIGHSDAVRAVTFLAGGETLASAGDDTTVRLWNAKVAGVN